MCPAALFSTAEFHRLGFAGAVVPASERFHVVVAAARGAQVDLPAGWASAWWVLQGSLGVQSPVFQGDIGRGRMLAWQDGPVRLSAPGKVGAIGIAEEYIPFAAMLIALCLAMRMDAMTAMGIMIGGYGIGYGVAALNPFTVQIAQGVAGLAPTSGWEFRLALFVPFVAIGVHHVWSYSRKVQADPSRSLMQGIEPRYLPPTTFPPMQGRRALVLLLSLLVLAAMVWGISQRGWYLVELGALFLALAVVAGLVGGLGADGTARHFITGASELAGTAVLVGFARSIALILEEGQLLHTLVDALAGPLQTVGPELAAVGMLVVQTLINFFIPSGSGQAFVTMPIMAPLGDLVGVSRQTAVLAYQFGDGFSNMIVPTNIVLMSILGIAGIPYDRWLRFIWPLLLKLTLAAAVALVVAVQIGYH